MHTSLSLSLNIPVTRSSFGCFLFNLSNYDIFVANGWVISAGAQRHSTMVCIGNANWLCAHIETTHSAMMIDGMAIAKPNGPCFWKYTAYWRKVHQIVGAIQLFFLLHFAVFVIAHSYIYNMLCLCCLQNFEWTEICAVCSFYFSLQKNMNTLEWRFFYGQRQL